MKEAPVTSPEDFGRLYEEYAQPIHDFLLRTVRNRAVAEDLTQTTFVKAFEKSENLRDKTKVKSWLFTIAHNLAMDAVTRNKPTQDIDDQADLASASPTPESEAFSSESAQLVWDAAASLEPRQYAVLDLTVRQGLTTPEVAAALEVEPSHAAVLVNRSKEALGNAVRYLLVARRRTHCLVLADIVPEGVHQLTPEQRTSVDHHMRRCDGCKQMGISLTKPAEILAAITAVPVPNSLSQQALSAMTTHHVAAQAVKGAAKVGKFTLTKAAVAAVVSAAVIGGSVVAITHLKPAGQNGVGNSPASAQKQPGATTVKTSAAPTPVPNGTAADFLALTNGLNTALDSGDSAVTTNPQDITAEVIASVRSATNAVRAYSSGLRARDWGSGDGDAKKLADDCDRLADLFDKWASAPFTLGDDQITPIGNAIIADGLQLERDLGIQGDPTGLFSS